MATPQGAAGTGRPADDAPPAPLRALCSLADSPVGPSPTCVPPGRPGACLRVLMPQEAPAQRRDARLGHPRQFVDVLLCVGCARAHLPRLLAERDRRLTDADALLPALLGAGPGAPPEMASGAAPRLVPAGHPADRAMAYLAELLTVLRENPEAGAIPPLNPDVPSSELEALLDAIDLACELLQATPALAIDGTPLRFALPAEVDSLSSETRARSDRWWRVEHRNYREVAQLCLNALLDQQWPAPHDPTGPEIAARWAQAHGLDPKQVDGAKPHQLIATAVRTLRNRADAALQRNGGTLNFTNACEDARQRYVYLQSQRTGSTG